MLMYGHYPESLSMAGVLMLTVCGCGPTESANRLTILATYAYRNIMAPQAA